MGDKAGKIFGPAGAWLLVLLGIGLLTRSQDIAAGVMQGLRISGTVLIPALFPFMVFSSFLVLSGGARIISVPLSLITKYVFRLPGQHGVVVLASLIGGYPVGGKMISTLLEQGMIDRSTAERMLGFCYGPSPSFMISAVGAGMLFDIRLGALLFAAQIVASALVGVIFSLKAPQPAKEKASIKTGGVVSAFVVAVNGASSAMINMCAFAVLFSGLLYLIKGSGAIEFLAAATRLSPDFIGALSAGLLEVTSGSAYAAVLGGQARIVLIAVFGAWGGLSAIFQVVSLFGKTHLSWRYFLVGRVLHCIFAAALSLAFYRLLYAAMSAVPTILHSAMPVMHSDNRDWVAAVCLLVMCAILTSNQEQDVDR
ncbi:MAG: hypothetical protein FWE19_05990 [Oscillospiraceae bacterium]|nr:hypothetical protein [Oscillospiraceae bacterium]